MGHLRVDNAFNPTTAGSSRVLIHKLFAATRSTTTGWTAPAIPILRALKRILEGPSAECDTAPNGPVTGVDECSSMVVDWIVLKVDVWA